ncbi:hypothetical protein [Loigolactobacillus backii]|uniref:hypothetical protein n=1 Tax=Loigolactobacillus backii TaxID=375175 RepID=UPI000AAA6B59|nr:hypothetical protein [Loigolactobacillus backii]MDA5387700.1 hypothetical protein [Loigolactobacillus backii]MDA5390232.1 hypothetical protein [Loigolactobacillus backii]
MRLSEENFRKVITVRTDEQPSTNVTANLIRRAMKDALARHTTTNKPDKSIKA